MFAAATKALIEFRAARKLKDYWHKVNEAKKPIIHTAESLYDYITLVRAKEVFGVNEQGKCKLIIDEHNKEIFKQLCMYFTEDKRFEEYTNKYGNQFSLKKGLFIIGRVGCGKTTVFELFNKNQKQSFVIKSCLRIADDYQKKGIEAIDKYFETVLVGDPMMFYGQTVLGTCFDDMGTEVEKNNFGNKANVMRDILLARYERKFKAGMTHITTNHTPTQIKMRYGFDEIDQERIASRLREMFNVITFSEDAPDRRI